MAVCELAGGGVSCVVVAAAGDAEGGADLPDSVAGGGVNVSDHFPKFGGVLVPRMTAAFFKMSFSTLRSEFSRRRARSSSAAALSPPARGPSLPSCVLCEWLFQ